jgi:hypothetical protein
VGKPILEFSEPLANDQLAPFAFLIVQRALVKALGDSNFVLRLVPLAAGILSLYLFANLARRVLARRPALIALILFAFSDDLIYYSSEMKPYSLDLVIGLAISLAAWEAITNPTAWHAKVVLAIAVALAPWCSFPSAFLIAGCGLPLLLTHLWSRRYGIALAWAVLGVAGLASFLASYEMSRRLLRGNTTMYRFWYFAFLPLWPWPVSADDLHKAGGILLEIFVNPLNLVAPIWPSAGVILPVLLVLLGGASLARRSGMTCLLLTLPIFLAIVASVLKGYPLHGRLMLELVPAFFILIAEGTEWLYGRACRQRQWLYGTILVLLLAYPGLSAFWNVVGTRFRFFNAHGDLHSNVFIE